MYIIMVAKKVTLSIPQDQDNFLTERNLSASAILQRGIREIQERDRPFEGERVEFRRKLRFIAEELKLRTDFLTEKNLQEDFEAWRQTKS